MYICERNFSSRIPLFVVVNLGIEMDDIKSVEDVYVNNSDFYYDCND